jgi:outer membrane biosynthesis protein TonB
MPARKTIPIIAVLVLSMTGCFLGGKKRAATPPPPKPPATAAKPPEEPLSIPQTKVQLPPPQPVDPRALETTERPPAPPPETAPAPRPQRRSAPIPTTGPQPPAETQPAPQQPAPEERPRLQEILSAEEKRKLVDEIHNRKREVYDILQHASRRNLSQADRLIVERVRSFLALSDQAAWRDDIRQADALSERAVVLARELRNAR